MVRPSALAILKVASNERAAVHRAHGGRMVGLTSDVSKVRRRRATASTRAGCRLAGAGAELCSALATA
jgi:hypothetical protein